MTTLIVLLRDTVGRSTAVVVHRYSRLPIIVIVISIHSCRRLRRCQIIFNGKIIVTCNNVVFVIRIRNTTGITSSSCSSCLVLVTYVSAHVHAFFFAQNGRSAVVFLLTCGRCAVIYFLRKIVVVVRGQGVVASLGDRCCWVYCTVCCC